MDRRTVSLAVVLLVLLSTVAGAGMGAAAGSPVDDSVAQETPGQPAADNTVTRIELARDGSARWTVTVRTRLETTQAAEEYRAFQTRFRENTSRFLDPFSRRIRSVVANAGEATGREMAAENFTARTHIQEVPRRWGVVTYAFTWVGFAAVEGETIRAGDAFAGGFFLAANDTLTVVVPAGYEVTRVDPAPTDRGDAVVSWTGRLDFPDGRPLVAAAPAGGADGADGPRSRLVDPTALAAGVTLLALLGGVAALAYRRRRGPAPAATDEERVLELLESRSGRIPQADVVEAFDWSTSKTSRVLARMADEGTIEKLQIGRENLIQLPDGED